MSDFFYAYPRYAGHPRNLQLNSAREHFRKYGMRLLRATRKCLGQGVTEVVFYGTPA